MRPNMYVCYLRVSHAYFRSVQHLYIHICLYVINEWACFTNHAQMALPLHDIFVGFPQKIVPLGHTIYYFVLVENALVRYPLSLFVMH